MIKKQIIFQFDLTSMLYWKYFQITLNATPCTTFVSNLVCNPLKNSPESPSFYIICLIT